MEPMGKAAARKFLIPHREHTKIYNGRLYNKLNLYNYGKADYISSTILKYKLWEPPITKVIEFLLGEDKNKYSIKSWNLKPGDAIAFNYATLHSAYGNNFKNRSRAFSLRLTGDDARYIKRQGEMSPPFPEVKLKNNEVLDCETFPVLISP